MPVKLIPLYATIALAMGAILSLAIFAIPAVADPAIAIELGFLESIDDPSKLQIETATGHELAAPGDMREASDGNSGAWQRGLGPVWVWNPAPDTPAPALIAGS